jgi:lysophospholipid acyltransferase (LPLAT)-like uncharacterized protein
MFSAHREAHASCSPAVLACGDQTHLVAIASSCHDATGTPRSALRIPHSVLLRHPLAIRLVAVLAAAIIRLWLWTTRIRIVTADGLPHPVDPATRRYIYAFWHEAMLGPIAVRPKSRVLISQHRDGELIAQICQRLGMGTIRGSTARGGSQALLEMIRGDGTQAHIAITPDGPRGPRRELKPGAIIVASQARLAIVPLGVGFTRACRAGNWDRFALPLPFTTMLGVIGEPIDVPQDLDRGQLATYQQLVQQQLVELSDLADDWAERIRKQGRCAEPPQLPQTAGRRKSA